MWPRIVNTRKQKPEVQATTQFSRLAGWSTISPAAIRRREPQTGCVPTLVLTLELSATGCHQPPSIGLLKPFSVCKLPSLLFLVRSGTSLMVLNTHAAATCPATNTTRIVQSDTCRAYVRKNLARCTSLIYLVLFSSCTHSCTGSCIMYSQRLPRSEPWCNVYQYLEKSHPAEPC